MIDLKLIERSNIGLMFNPRGNQEFESWAKPRTSAERPPPHVSEAGQAELRKHRALVLLTGNMTQSSMSILHQQKASEHSDRHQNPQVRECLKGRLEQDNPRQNVVTFVFALHFFLQLPSIWGI